MNAIALHLAMCFIPARAVVRALGRRVGLCLRRPGCVGLQSASFHGETRRHVVPSLLPWSWDVVRVEEAFHEFCQPSCRVDLVGGFCLVLLVRGLVDDVWHCEASREAD